MTAGAADDLAQGDRQAGSTARLATVKLHRPVGTLLLARGADEDLVSLDRGTHPRALPLVGIERGSAAEEAPRTRLRDGEWRLGRAHEPTG